MATPTTVEDPTDPAFTEAQRAWIDNFLTTKLAEAAGPAPSSSSSPTIASTASPAAGSIMPSEWLGGYCV